MIVLIAGAYFGLVTVLMSEIDVLFKLLLTMRISTEK